MDNFTKVLEKYYREGPEQTAIHLLDSKKPDHLISYRELIHSSGRYSGALYDAGIKPGEVVIIILEHGPDLISAFWGSILFGSIPSIMPFLTEKLQPDQYRHSLAALFRITKPAAVVTYPQFRDEAIKASHDTSVRAVITTDQVKRSALGTSEPDPATFKGKERSQQDIVLLQHSSGTTFS